MGAVALQEWLERIAVEDRAAAADLFVRLLEYHVPKLARSEIAVQAVPARALRRMSDLSIAELDAIAAGTVDEAQYRAMLSLPAPVVIDAEPAADSVQIGSLI